MRFLAWRYAARELRSGVKGFRIFLACLALGVAAIAAAGSTAEAFRTGLAVQAREILGGDMAVSLEQRRFTEAERKAIEAAGATSWAVGTRAMAQAASGERRLVDLRGVSEAYPLSGKVTLETGQPLARALAVRDGVAGAAVERALLERLGLKIGDQILVGEMPVVVRDVLLEEPDRLSRGFALGPRVLVRRQAVAAGGFLEPGLTFAETARVALPPGTDLKAARQDLRKALKDKSIRIRDREDAAPGIRWLIDQLEYFLGFIGLASLVAGGLGVFGAVAAFLEARKPSIAVLKALGAEGPFIRDLYLIQIGVLALLGVAIGLAVGAAAPFILGGLVPDDIPVPALFDIYPVPLLKAAAFGLLSAAAFSLTPLARARVTPPASLFRRDVGGRLKLSVETVGAGVAALALAALSVITAPTPLAAAGMIGGVAVSFVLLWGLGLGAAWLAGRLRGKTRGSVRMGLANLAGPRSAARTAAPAIGLGVALLAAVVLIQSSLLRQVAEVAPRTAPALVFTEIPGARAAEFDAAVAAAFAAPLTPETYLRAPFLTGRIIRLGGMPVNRSAINEQERWAYDNDISLSAIGPEPKNAKVVEGRWWPADYAGPPLLAMEVDAARAGRLKVGNLVTLSVLGREIEAKVAVLREVDVGGFGASFPLVLNPSALEGAELRHVAIAKASRAQEARVGRALGAAFPEVNVISVREQLEAATDLFDRLALAIRGAAGVAALAGLLVLTGAIAARAQARAREATILKVLGASRLQILGAYVLEYGAVGLIAGVTGVGLGVIAAWPVVTLVFKADWAIDWGGVAALVGGAALLAGLGGLLASLQALAKRPADALRAE
ncbi:FtsX-like permease family protein [Phenylobacterium sp. LH3H17]|uniref:ABC transporter permease n=1 Tax=Phenylobacterium sp. LH3H17 TaxID=2903901 RepID=UPI0020C9E1B6|nr:FtsX-like permease family protein [Phenylobacterium sp. LH3H17]UTP41054.1 FtsX-like permease family protein [Phenylobacterium sp. LH3H17]